MNLSAVDAILPSVLPAVYTSDKRFLCEIAHDVLDSLVSHCTGQSLILALLHAGATSSTDDPRLANLVPSLLLTRRIQCILIVPWFVDRLQFTWKSVWRPCRAQQLSRSFSNRRCCCCIYLSSLVTSRHHAKTLPTSVYCIFEMHLGYVIIPCIDVQ